MQTFNYTVTDENGIHARPAGVIVGCAKNFSSAVNVTLGEKNADCKKLFSVMSLGAEKGDTLVVSVEGEDEKAAAEALKRSMEDAGL